MAASTTEYDNEEPAEVIHSVTKVGRDTGLIESRESRQANIDGVIAKLDEIWEFIHEIDFDPKNKNETDGIIADIKENYPDIMVLIPVCVQLMVLEDKRSTKALRTVLKTRVNNKEDFLLLQAAYVTELFHEVHPNMTRKELLAYRSRIHERLIKEDEHMVEASKEMEVETAKYEELRKQRAIAQLKKSLEYKKTLNTK